MGTATQIENARRQALREQLIALTPAQREMLAARLSPRAAQPRLVAAVVTRPGSELVPEVLRDWLRARLPEYMTPAVIEQMTALPSLPNGKVDRTALARREWLSPSATPASADPQAADAATAALEQTLAGIWSAVLDVSPIDRGDDFFELGGDSITAMRVVSRASRAGLLMNINDLMTHRTLSAVAAVIARTRLPMAVLSAEKLSVSSATPEQSQSVFKPAVTPVPPAALRHVIAIQLGGGRPPLFLAHHGAGSIFGYESLPRYLGDDQPLYGFHEAGWEEGDVRPRSLEQMATDYVAEMRAVSPRGPYYVGGFCFGGIVAFEMARQLRQAGQEVASLILIDAIAPNVSFAAHVAANRRDSIARLKTLPLPAKAAFVADRIRRRAYWAVVNRYTALRDRFWLRVHTINTRLGLPVSSKVQGLAFMYHNYDLQQRYQGGVLDGSAVVIRSQRPHVPADDGWNSLLATPVEVCQMRTEEHLAMLFEPHVRELAGYLRAAIDSGMKRQLVTSVQQH